MTSACENEPELTCEEKKAAEKIRAVKAAEDLEDAATLNDLLYAFFMPKWATDLEDQQHALARYLACHELCRPGNNAGKECVPCEEPEYTGCPDPDACPSKFYGYGLLEVIKAAVRADAMEVIPYHRLDEIQHGEGLVWDTSVLAENADCDPCLPNTLGAFVPRHVFDELHPA